MTRTLKLLLLSALGLSSAGWFIYHLGSRMNLLAEKGDPTLWEQAPGDIWLYVGGLMMLISGALTVAAFLFWRGNRGEMRATLSDHLGDSHRGN